MKNVVIIGASHAGTQCAINLRQGGWDGNILLIGNEADLPYHRPPLSKDFLSGTKELDEILIRPASVYESYNITLKLGTQVTAVNRDTKTVGTDKGDTIAYDKLVLATGARVRKLPIAGADDPRVMYLRDTDDVRAIKAAIAKGKSAVIIGGGYIGLETAASMRKRGMEVIVLEAMDRILQRVTAPIMSDFYRRIHREEGVIIDEKEMASAINVAEEKLVVQTQKGNFYPADIVIIGIGVIPNTELAAEAGLDVADGIIVNEFCQTSDTDIYGIGDVTWHYNPIYDTYLRLESVPNATEQGKTAALHINGQEKPYNSLPWFWSDQFDLKLQIAGLSQGYDDIVIRGQNETSRSFAVFYFKGDKLLAVDAVNAPREFMMARMALTKGQTLDKDTLVDTNADLKNALLPQT